MSHSHCIVQRSPARRLSACRAGVVVLTAFTLLTACEKPAPRGIQGYIEGEFVRVASPITGTLEKLHVHRGDQITAKAPLFALESDSERADREEAVNRLKTAQARLDNLLSGKRAPEMDVVQAQLAQALAARDLSDAELKRQRKLYSEGFVSGDHMDSAKSAYARDVARVEELRAQIKSARQTLGRDAEIKAAQGEVDAARAVLAQRDWRLGQKAVSAAADALVYDTYFTQGEWVPAGSPVLSLLPPGNVKVRFYLPEPRLGNVKSGQTITLGCDGCKAPVAARITYISRQAEYTPPVIYSEGSRAKLVYLIEARPEPAAAATLHVGQPVDVRID